MPSFHQRSPFLTSYLDSATNQTIYEISPIEFGSWQGRAQAFAPTSLLGTPLKAGVPVNESECVTGWDSSAWVLGAAIAAQAVRLLSDV